MDAEWKRIWPEWAVLDAKFKEGRSAIVVPEIKENHP
jgi:hypothetical protein